MVVNSCKLPFSINSKGSYFIDSTLYAIHNQAEEKWSYEHDSFPLGRKTRLGELAERAARGEEIVIRRRGKSPVSLVSRAVNEVTPEQRAEKLGKQHRLTADKQARLELLAQKNQANELTAAERREMTRLLREFGKLTAARAQALSEMP